MNEYFIHSTSFAAPFFSEEDFSFAKGDTPEDTLLSFVKDYSHPSGLYAAVLYETADDYHKGRKPLMKWLCNHEIEKRKLTDKLGSYSYFGNNAGDFEIDGVRHKIKNPKEGRIVT